MMKRVMTLAFVTGLAAAAVGQTIYFEGFDDPDVTGGNGNLVGVYDWVVHLSDSGENSVVSWPGNPLSPSGGDSGYQARIVNDAAAPSPSNRFFGFRSGGTMPSSYLLWTEAFSPIDPALYDDLSISYYHNQASSHASTRGALAVDTGGGIQWYAWDSPVPGVDAWTQATFDLLASNWVPFAFDGTATTSASGAFALGAGPAGFLDPGAIVAAGAFITFPASNTVVRFDSFEIAGTLTPEQVIPEPGSATLLLGAAALLFARRRLRGRR